MIEKKVYRIFVSAAEPKNKAIEDLDEIWIYIYI